MSIRAVYRELFQTAFLCIAIWGAAPGVSLLSRCRCFLRLRGRAEAMGAQPREVSDGFQIRLPLRVVRQARQRPPPYRLEPRGQPSPDRESPSGRVVVSRCDCEKAWALVGRIAGPRRRGR